MGQFTNGFNGSIVTDALKGRLAWRQPTKEGSPVLNSENTTSASGRYFNDGSFHPLVTVENLKATIEDPALADDGFNNMLSDLRKSVISQALTAVFNEPEVIDQGTLFDRSTNNDQLISNSSRFVGIRFKLAPGSIALQIKSISLYFNQAKDFNLYLYHDAKKEAIWSEQVSSVADDQTLVIPTTELILAQSSSLYKSGYFYLGYYQDDLDTAQAYKELFTRSSKCAVGWDFFTAAKQGDDFNRREVSLTGETYGLNAEIITFHDHTSAILRSVSLFDNLIGLQMAYYVGKQILYSVRSNGSERILKEQLSALGLQYDMEGRVPISDTHKTLGLAEKITEEVKRLRQSFNPSHKSQIVSYADC
jgi:hypothetical protein